MDNGGAFERTKGKTFTIQASTDRKDRGGAGKRENV